MAKEGGPAGNEKYAVQVIKSLEEMGTYRTEWDDIASGQADSIPFMGFDWFYTWLKNFVQDDEIWILLLYEKGVLVCIAPFLKKGQKVLKLQVMKFELIGNVYSPYRNFLFRETDFSRKREQVCAVLTWLEEHGGSWDLIDIAAVPEEGGCFSLISEAVQETGLQSVEHVAYGDWYVDDIRCSGDEFIEGLPKKIKKDVSYCLRRLQKEFSVEFRIVRDSLLVPEYMRLYYEVYAKSWQRSERVGPRFHRDLAEVAARKGWLRLGVLMADEQAIAAQFWITSNATSYILKTVYDQAYKKYSPGKVLTAEMVKYVIDEDGINLIDYVQGDEPYKRDWTPKRRERKGLTIFGRSSKGRILGLLIGRIRPIVNENPVFRRTKDSVKRLFLRAE